MPRRKRALFGVTRVGRRCCDAGMDQGGQLTVFRRAQSDTLFGDSAAADGAEDSFTRQRQLYWPAHKLRRSRAKCDVVPESDFAAETAPDKGRDHANVFPLKIEYVGQSMGGQINGLRGIVHRQAAVVVPDGNRRVRFNGIVVVAGSPINMVDAYFRP